MPRHIALLRGINVSGHRKVPMAQLRDALTAAGATGVATYVQSGNVVLDGSSTEDTAARVEAVLAATFGLEDVPVLVRDAEELAAIVAEDPFAGVADDPARQAVLFLGGPVDPARLDGLPVVAPDGLVPSASGRELHLWTPEGFGTSKLAARLTDRTLGTTVTARNWRTVTKLLALASA